ncbi:MAG: hypothetical protein mread185_000388 [Mycoplasmataceae bacterium]|nr:MAG: hypothetical protein mread185_000388 [Mycoplasmataceae bacterium]
MINNLNSSEKKDLKKETLLNSPAPNDLALVKTGSEIPSKIIKILLLIIFLALVAYYLFK